MDITINLVSSICWEIIAKQPIRLNVETLPVFKLLLDSLYDYSPLIAEGNLRMYWRYSPEDYLEITDHFSFSAFLNLTAESNLYLIIEDSEKFHADTDKFLAMLDLIELKRVKELNRNKYNLKSEADEIEAQIQECRKSFQNNSTSKIEPDPKDAKEIIRFALRNMPMGRCYTADICSGYSLIDCVRKGWPTSKKILTPLPNEVIERKTRKDKGKLLESEKGKKNKRKK